MSLPAELRNDIYKLALGEHDTVRIRYRRRFYRSLGLGHYHSYHRDRGEPWRELALLQTSRAIRHEASAIYYGSNSFQITVQLSDLPAASAWLRSIVARCGTNPFRQFRFYLCQPCWRGLHFLRDFVQLFREVDLQLGTGSASKWPCRRRSALFWSESGESGVLDQALDEAVELGKKARAEDWSEDWLDVEFGLWVEEKLSKGNALAVERRVKKRRRLES